jgi:hypothetical protein
MKWTLPVSTYFSLNGVNVVSWKCAQWEQVIEAYSITVTGADGSPSVISPSGPATRSSSPAVCATAVPANGIAEPDCRLTY